MNLHSVILNLSQINGHRELAEDQWHRMIGAERQLQNCEKEILINTIVPQSTSDLGSIVIESS